MATAWRIGPRGGDCGSVESTYLFVSGSHHLALMNSCHNILELGPELPDLLTFQAKNQMFDSFVKYLTLRYWLHLKQTIKQTKANTMWAKQSTFMGDTCSTAIVNLWTTLFVYTVVECNTEKYCCLPVFVLWRQRAILSETVAHLMAWDLNFTHLSIIVGVLANCCTTWSPFRF